MSATPDKLAHRSCLSQDLWLDRFGHMDPLTGELVVKRWTRERVVMRLQAFAREHGRSPSRRDLHGLTKGQHSPPTVSMVRWPNYTTVRELFGSLDAALEAAGLDRPERLRAYERRVRCAECGRMFTARQSTARFCDRNCAHAAKLVRMWAEQDVTLRRCACGCRRHAGPGK